ncbi:LysM peptidoglycan-binding domain-containing protein [Neobacillus niacini]|uniref:cell division suppressor protein YneA n=1 Tax=Neobacillus niacini TaxID=86668 RepID=UPI0021CB0EB4|nr:LysM peptidoglycan-binding domain-containing protein [Neobacillus niacini]MCM3765604.1 LysM peptidoglycan-binding domain-containing protein [Neobacillus niacini]
MRKLWNQYSYAIILLILSCAAAVIISSQGNSDVEEEYIKVTVSEGDSLWGLSKEYASMHSLTNKEFVNWVKKHNKNVDEKIFPGEEIVIPVSVNEPSLTQFASAPGE